MSTFQFVWQIIVICGLVTAVIYGLLVVPWYVLGAFLVVALLGIYRLMPNGRLSVLPEVEGAGELGSPTLDSDRSEQPRSPDLCYRGAHYPATATPSPTAPPSEVLSYRGAHYSPGHSTPNTEASPTETVAPPELKYRGAKVKSSTPSTHQ